MADFEQFKPTNNTADHLTKIPAFVDVLNVYANEIEAARGGHANLDERLGLMPTLSLMNAAFQTADESLHAAIAAIDPDAPDWSTLGEAGQDLRINGAGTAVQGYDNRAKHLFWRAM